VKYLINKRSLIVKVPAVDRKEQWNTVVPWARAMLFLSRKITGCGLVLFTGRLIARLCRNYLPYHTIFKKYLRYLNTFVVMHNRNLGSWKKCLIFLRSSGRRLAGVVRETPSKSTSSHMDLCPRPRG
jgi:hypothetical protein